MYCGKAYGDICNNNDECSSKQCNNGYCSMQTYGPNESEGLGLAILLFIYIFIFLIIFLIIYI